MSPSLSREKFASSNSKERFLSAVKFICSRLTQQAAFLVVVILTVRCIILPPPLLVQSSLLKDIPRCTGMIPPGIIPPHLTYAPNGQQVAGMLVWGPNNQAPPQCRRGNTDNNHSSLSSWPWAQVDPLKKPGTLVFSVVLDHSS
jgi:hypothetical protein